MRHRFLGLTLALLAGAAFASPFPKGDPKAGEKLVKEAKCGACHASMFGGDGSAIYTRPDRKIKNPEQLRTQVRFCATQLGVSWFPEEEENVAAYLNQQYYKFK